MTKITPKRFKQASENSNGVQALVAQRLKVTRGSVNQYVKKHPEALQILDDERESLGDYSEGNIAADIRRGNTDLSKWHLLNSSVGKARGYGPKTEIEHSGVAGIIFEEVIKSSKEIKDGKKLKTN